MKAYSNPHVDHYADRFRLLGLKRLGYNLLQYFANPRRCEMHDRYDRLRLDRHGMTFSQFLADPARGEELALLDEPPLPSQHAAILRLWADQDTGLARRPPAEPATPAPHWSDDMLMDWRELVEQWRAEADHAEAAVAHLPQRNGTFVEPLHHHRHPRRAGAGFVKRGEA